MEKITVISDHHTYLNQIVAELRDEEIQKSRMRFRINLERAGALIAYEISKHLNYKQKVINTPLGTAKMALPVNTLIVTSILRAGLPMHNGILNVFDQAESGFVSAYRHHTDENEFEVRLEYIAVPNLKGKSLILADPMVATGRSIEVSYQHIIENEEPKEIFISCVIASEEGIEHVRRHIPKARIFVGAVDKELTAKSFVVPGLGDAGNLAFGNKE